MPAVERGRRSRKATVPALGPVEGRGYRARGDNASQAATSLLSMAGGWDECRAIGRSIATLRARAPPIFRTHDTSNTQGFPGTSAHWLNSRRDLRESPTRCRLQAADSDPLPPLGHLGKPASRHTSPTGDEISSFSSNLPPIATCGCNRRLQQANTYHQQPPTDIAAPHHSRHLGALRLLSVLVVRGANRPAITALSTSSSH